MSQMSHEEFEKYARLNKTGCPYCGSMNVISEGPSWPNHRNELINPAKCEACGRGWDEQYQLVGVTVYHA